MARLVHPNLGQLFDLPLELRYQIYEHLDEDYCFQVVEPVSLFESNRHDPCIPHGVSRASKAIWQEVSQLLHSRHPRILKVRICVNGWRSNYPPSAFRENWEAPDLSFFNQLAITVLPPPPDDPAQALLIRRNIISFVDVLNNAKALPATTLLFGEAAAAWDTQHFNRLVLTTSHLPNSPERFPPNTTLLLALALSFQHLRRCPSATITAPTSLPTSSPSAALARLRTSLTLRKRFNPATNTTAPLPTHH
ncbi:hypothetical protein AOQ84DRAFT_230017, partial [Glonium stellatum]